MSLTPMMQQFFEIKEKYKDCLLLYRLGDFYELFFDDAIIASKVLNLVLTGKDCGLEERAPMCGVPHHAVDSYIKKLISEKYKVAICEQLEDPSKAKGMVKRGVVRVITPGTITDIDMLNDSENNYIMSIFSDNKTNMTGFAYCDVSTGVFYIYEHKNDEQTIYNEILKIKPKEILVSDSFLEDFKTIANKINYNDFLINSYFDYAFNYDFAYSTLIDHFKVSSLKCFDCEQYNFALIAGGALISYLHETQKNSLEHINTIKVYNSASNMIIDSTAIRNLELTKTIIDGKKRGSLLWLLDKTKTSLGSRMLRQYLENPLKSKKLIQKRLDAVKELVSDNIILEKLSANLSDIYDLERLISKISYSTLNAKDCIALKLSLLKLPELKNTLGLCQSNLISEINGNINPLDDIYNLIQNAIKDDAGLSVRDGNIIKTGFDDEVDRLREISDNAKNWLVNLENKEKEITGIPKLKIGYNKIYGYYIEVTNSYKDKIPAHYIGKQTLVNCERYITSELKDMEDSIINAEERKCAREYELFNYIRLKLSECISEIQNTAKAIACIDVIQAFARVSYTNKYVMPVLANDGRIKIVKGRHPVVEVMTSGSYVPNDIDLNNEKSMLVITGPNMAGKSTYMRQIGLIVIMAQIGCFVPCDSAHISLVDRIFTRVGASDDVSSGQSTFMIEMNELSVILNNATKDSLLILDEIGRGTSTTDGLSIAWATIEYIIERIGSKTMFATHYHELIELEKYHSQIKNCSIAVRQFGNDIIFLHKIILKGTDQSFGVEVAKLAGLPNEVIEKARELLFRFQKNEIRLPVDAIEAVNDSKKTFTDCERKILSVDVNNLTPLEALNLICSLQEVLTNE